MSYSVVLSDVSKWTDEDKSDIKGLYSTFFNELGLEFNPSLDSDFVHPEKYFMEQDRGAYVTLFYAPATTSKTSDDKDADNITSSKSERPHIVGVVGARNYSDAKNEFLGDNCCEVKRMYIAEQHRGGARGRRIFQALMEKIFEFKYARIVLDTKARLKAANTLYEQFGFVDTGNYNENERADRWMKKDVSNENATMGFIRPVAAKEEEKFA